MSKPPLNVVASAGHTSLTPQNFEDFIQAETKAPIIRRLVVLIALGVSGMLGGTALKLKPQKFVATEASCIESGLRQPLKTGTVTVSKPFWGGGCYQIDGLRGGSVWFVPKKYDPDGRKIYGEFVSSGHQGTMFSGYLVKLGKSELELYGIDTTNNNQLCGKFVTDDEFVRLQIDGNDGKAVWAVCPKDCKIETFPKIPDVKLVHESYDVYSLDVDGQMSSFKMDRKNLRDVGIARSELSTDGKTTGHIVAITQPDDAIELLRFDMANRCLFIAKFR